MLIRDAQVETVTVQLLESSPVKVVATVSGILGDGCTSIHEVTQSHSNTAFMIKVSTERPADAMCTQVVKSYTETVNLETKGLTAGTYIVSANGVTTTFELQ